MLKFDNDYDYEHEHEHEFKRHACGVSFEAGFFKAGFFEALAKKNSEEEWRRRKAGIQGYGTGFFNFQIWL
jgi:hypothetical protein